MPVTKIKPSTIPSSRFQNSPLYSTPEWKDALKEAKKLKPNEALQVVLSSDTVAALPLKDPIRAFVVALRRVIERLELPVDVTTRVNEEEGSGLDIFIVGRNVNLT